MISCNGISPRLPDRVLKSDLDVKQPREIDERKTTKEEIQAR